MRTRLNSMGWLVVTGWVLVGCQATGRSSHEENVNAANERWQTMRSTLVLQLAQQQFDTGDLDLSEKTLLEAISIDNTNAKLHVLGGRLALERGQLERGYHRLSTAIEMDPDLAEAYYYRGLVLQRWSRYEPALTEYRRAYELLPDNVAYLLAVSEMLVAVDRVGEGLELLINKTNYFDQNAGIRVAIGRLYMMKHQFKEAAEYFHQALLLQPDDLQVLEAMATAQLAAGQSQEAVENLERLCAEPGAREDFGLKRLLANGYLAMGRHTEAKRAFIELTRHNPRDLDAWCKLGELSWAQKDIPSTLSASRRILLLSPASHEGYLLTGLARQKQGRLNEALLMYDRAAQLDPDSAVPAILKGLALEQDGQRAAAAASYAEALRRQPDNPRAQRLLDAVALKTAAH